MSAQQMKQIYDADYGNPPTGYIGYYFSLDANTWVYKDDAGLLYPFSEATGHGIIDIADETTDFTIQMGKLHRVATGGANIIATTPGSVTDGWIFGVQCIQNGTVFIDSTTPPAKMINNNTTSWFIYKSGEWFRTTGTPFDMGVVTASRADTETLIPNMVNYVSGSSGITLTFPNPEACEKNSWMKLSNKCDPGTIVQVDATGGYGPSFYSTNKAFNPASTDECMFDNVEWVNNGAAWEEVTRNIAPNAIGGGGGGGSLPDMTGNAGKVLTTDGTDPFWMLPYWASKISAGSYPGYSFTASANEYYDVGGGGTDASVYFPAASVGDKIIFYMSSYMGGRITIDSDGHVIRRSGQSATYTYNGSSWVRTSEVLTPPIKYGGQIDYTGYYARILFSYTVYAAMSDINVLWAYGADSVQQCDTLTLSNIPASGYNSIFDPSGLNHATTPGNASTYIYIDTSWKLLATTMSGGGGGSYEPLMTYDSSQTGSFTASPNYIHDLGGLSTNCTVAMPSGVDGDKIIFLLSNYTGNYVEFPDGTRMTKTGQSAVFRKVASGWIKTSGTNDNIFRSGGIVTGSTNAARPGFKYIMDGSSGTVNLDPSSSYGQIENGDLIQVYNLAYSSYTATFDTMGSARIIPPGVTMTFVYDDYSWKRLSTTRPDNSQYTDVGFFGMTPVAQQTSSGAQTASGSWTSTEQTMLQQAYDALRAYGLLS